MKKLLGAALVLGCVAVVLVVVTAPARFDREYEDWLAERQPRRKGGSR